jgi:hypothetical protein
VALAEMAALDMLVVLHISDSVEGVCDFLNFSFYIKMSCLDKKSLLLKIILHNKQTLQLN